MTDTQVQTVLPNLVDINEHQQAVLLGSQCPSCQHYDYPAGNICSHCGETTETCSLGREATIYSFTTVRVKPPLDLPRPYSVAYLDMANAPLRIFALLLPEQETQFEIGQQVELQLLPMGSNNAGDACLRPVFALPSAN